MALQDYAKLNLAYNGNWLEQITSVQHATNSGQQRIDLLNEGLGGFTPGSGDVTITVGYAIPIGGTEDDFQQHCATGAYVTLQIVQGRHDYTGRGKITENSASQSVGAAAEGSFTWVGELKPFEG